MISGQVSQLYNTTNKAEG